MTTLMDVSKHANQAAGSSEINIRSSYRRGAPIYASDAGPGRAGVQGGEVNPGVGAGGDVVQATAAAPRPQRTSRKVLCFYQQRRTPHRAGRGESWKEFGVGQRGGCQHVFAHRAAMVVDPAEPTQRATPSQRLLFHDIDHYLILESRHSI